MKLIVFIFLFLISFCVKGQNSPESYLNEGAKMYVSNNIDAALEIVNQGIKKYPSNKKLKELKEKLEEKKKENKDKDDKKEEKKDKEKEDDKGKEKPENKGKPNEDKQQEDGKPKPKPGGIPQQRVENLLDAVNNEEKKIQNKVNANKVKGTPVQSEKDW